MEISIREAAPLLGRSARAVRARIARGELAARRHGRTWMIPLATLPLTAEQRESMQRRAEVAHRALDAVLPSRAGIDRQRSKRSVLDVTPFANGVALLREMAQSGCHDDDTQRVRRLLRRALVELAAAVMEFDAQHKIPALRAARGLFGRAAGVPLTGAESGWRAAVRTYLADHLHLRLKHENAPVLSCRGHLDGLGMRIRRGVIEPLPATWRRLRDRLGRHVRGREVLGADAMRQALASAMGHAFFG